MSDPYRCSLASEADHERIAGTAPTERAVLCVEHDGSWGRKALAESRLPAEVRVRLAELAGVRVQLIRRHGRGTRAGTQVYAARRRPDGWAVEAAVLDRPEELLDLPLAALSEQRSAGLPAYADPLWLVCTNGRRDVCCSERGRPVAAALAARWPAGTWETTHLGGHRFAATLLALPSGVALGRLDPARAVAAAEELLAGRVPLTVTRGSAGQTPAAQAAELRLRADLAEPRLDAVRVVAEDGEAVLLETGGARWRVPVTGVPGPPRQQSCADALTGATKAATVWLAGEPRPD